MPRASDRSVCDSFESFTEPWTIATGNALAQTEVVHGGNQALLSSIVAMPEDVSVRHLLPTISAEPMLFAREWIYASSSFDFQHINLFALISPTPGEGISVYVFSNIVNVYHDTPETGGFMAVALPLDRWFCVELGIDVRDSGGSVTLWVDDEMVLSAPNVDTHPTGGFEWIEVGLPYTGPTQTGPAAIYTDDVVVDVTHIGCTP